MESSWPPAAETKIFRSTNTMETSNFRAVEYSLGTRRMSSLSNGTPILIYCTPHLMMTALNVGVKIQMLTTTGSASTQWPLTIRQSGVIHLILIF